MLAQIPISKRQDKKNTMQSLEFSPIDQKTVETLTN